MSTDRPSIRRLRAFSLEPGTIVSDKYQIIDLLGSYRDAGLDYAIVYFADAAYDDESLTLFAEQVAPALR